ncbi:S8 family serine peptidase [Saccharothrix sp. NPDC042600]|uniref:S8 family peptidase n=1 Tax=Saccharothrix TaxID=2071 RepID=UPI0033DE2265|nr:S8 family serine peptidase [Saccharothrix mutabilis subsp. capreolus]
MRPLTLVVAACLLGASTTAAGAHPGPSTPDSTIQLVTGDEVVVHKVAGRDVHVPRAGKGREHIRFTRYELAGRHFVVPSDAAAAVAAGTVDEALFDVDALARNGRELALIVQGRTSDRTLRSLSGAALRVDREGAARVWARRSPGQKVWLDRRVEVALDRSIPRIGAPEAWAGGHTGQGVKVAVLDTGVDGDHPDLAGAVAEARDFTGSGTEDRHGHGTHVASTIRGAGDTRYRGGAPGSTLLSGKVLDDGGSGYLSWVVAGMEWATARGARVVNLSLGTNAPSAGDDVMSLAVDRLTRETGALFVVAAGNNPAVLGSPAAAAEALTVGAVDHQDVVAGFSARGPRALDGLLKPEITAPGVEITAARAKGTDMGAPVDEHHTTASGTSMATPHVAATAALLAEHRPDWRAPDLKAALMTTSHVLPGATVYAQGAGRVDAARAVRQPVHVSPGALNFGPIHEASTTRDLTFHNTGPNPVTLKTAVDPPGIFTVDPEIAVPPRSTVTTRVRADINASVKPGPYSGRLTASSVDGWQLNLPIALTKEAVPHRNVTINALDSNGNPFTAYPLCVNLDTGERCPFAYREDGTLRTRVPVGRYVVATNVFEQDRVSAVVHPGLEIREDTTVTLDARTAKQSSVTLERPVEDQGAMLTVACDAPTGKVLFGATTARTPELHITPAAGTPQCRSTFGTVHQSEVDSYHLVFHRPDGIPEPTWKPKDADLAAVRARHAVQGGRPQKVVKSTAPIVDGWFAVPYNTITLPQPGTRTEFRSPGPWTWYTYANTFSGDTFLSQQLAYTTHEKPGRTTERWNAAVFGPSLAPVDSAAHRYQDTMFFQIPLHGDQNPDHAGFMPGMTGTVGLYRDHDLLAPGSLPYGNVSAWAQAPPEPGRYRLVVDATQETTPLSSRITAEWVFHSARTADQVPLPLRVIRFAPPVDDENSAPRGREFRVPVTVQGTGAPVMGISAFASYDEGGTWRPVHLLPAPGGWEAVLHHPADAGTVSLRATATDADGGGVSQTVLRTYYLK